MHQGHEGSAIATQHALVPFGTSATEWVELAQWAERAALSTRFASNNTWLIRVPRIAEIRRHYRLENVQQQLDNLFLPLWEASVRVCVHA